MRRTGRGNRFFQRKMRDAGRGKPTPFLVLNKKFSFLNFSGRFLGVCKKNEAVHFRCDCAPVRNDRKRILMLYPVNDGAFLKQ